MASRKRAGDGGKPDDTEGAKKLRMDDEEPEIPMVPFKEGIPKGPDDSKIKSAFNALLGDIETFAQAYFIGSPHNFPQSKEHKTFFNNLTPLCCLGYLKCKTMGPKEKIIRAAIWNKLIKHLLEAPTKAFLDVSEATFKKNYSGSLKQFCTWRAFTAEILTDSYTAPLSWDKDGAGRKAFVTETLALIVSLSSLKKNEGNLEVLRGRLDKIAHLASKLAKEMARSWAYWVCTMEDPESGSLHNFSIKRDCMAVMDVVTGAIELSYDDEEQELETVDLVVSPMLLKFGNVSGEDYDDRVVIENALVVTEPMDSSD